MNKKELKHEIEKLQTKLSYYKTVDLNNEIKDLTLEYHNTDEARTNMVYVKSYVYDLIKGLNFTIKTETLSFKGVYKYKLIFNTKINIDYIKDHLDFLKPLYKAIIFVDDYTVYVGIHPKHLNKEPFDDFDNYKKSITTIKKFNL